MHRVPLFPKTLTDPTSLSRRSHFASRSMSSSSSSAGARNTPSNDTKVKDRTSQGDDGLAEDIVAIEQQIGELEDQIGDLAQRKNMLQLAHINQQMEELTKRRERLIKLAEHNESGSDVASVGTPTYGREKSEDENRAGHFGNWYQTSNLTPIVSEPQIVRERNSTSIVSEPRMVRDCTCPIHGDEDTLSNQITWLRLPSGCPV